MRFEPPGGKVVRMGLTLFTDKWDEIAVIYYFLCLNTGH